MSPRLRKFMNALVSASSGTVVIVGAVTMGCGATVSPSGDGAPGDGAPDAVAETSTSSDAANDTTSETTADALVCSPLSTSCPAARPLATSCGFGGDPRNACPCFAGMSCAYPEPPGGGCGPETCTCVVGDAGPVGHWECCSPCVGPLAPPELAA